MNKIIAAGAIHAAIVHRKVCGPGHRPRPDDVQLFATIGAVRARVWLASLDAPSRRWLLNEAIGQIAAAFEDTRDVTCTHESASGVLDLADLADPAHLTDQVWRCDSCGWFYRSVSVAGGLNRMEPVWPVEGFGTWPTPAPRSSRPVGGVGTEGATA